jgi:hypothetical protein
MLERQPANRPAPGTAIVTDKGLAGEDTEDWCAPATDAYDRSQDGRECSAETV